MRIIDILEAFRKCGLSMKQCPDKHPCPLHCDIKAYHDHLMLVFQTKAVQDLLVGNSSGEFFITYVHEGV